MTLDIQYEVKGLDELLARIADPAVFQPLTRRMEMAAITIENAAKTNAPVDTGRLRASITHQVTSDVDYVEARIGPNVTYGAYMEYGTGRLTDFPGGGKGSHWPPGAALDVWASRHGFASGYQVARIIGKRGGLAPRRYLRNALRDNLAKIIELIGRTVQDVAQRLGTK